MLRRLLKALILAALTTLCLTAAPAEGLTLAPEKIVGFQENALVVTSPAAGHLTVTLRDSLNTYRTLEQDVASGAIRLSWDGLSQQGERLPTGGYTWEASLAAANGQTWTASAPAEVLRARQALLFALPSSDTLVLNGGEDWFVELAMVRAGTVVMEVRAEDRPQTILLTRRKNVDSTEPNKWKWDGRNKNQPVAPGRYTLRFYAAENPAWAHTLPLTVTDTASLPAVLPTGAVLPADGASDAEIWALMRRPSVVVDIKNTNHQQVYAQPGTGSTALGTLHGQSQCLEVLDIAGDWARVTAWNHERGEQMTGYVPLKNLKTAEPNGPYGLLIDKRTQTMALFEDGRRLVEVPVSTGLVARDRLIRETAAGSFLTVERIAGFADSGYYYDYPIRYDGGNLIHQLGYKKVNGRSDFRDQTPQLGQKASHGCVRVQRDADAETGLSAYWLWTHLPYHTRVMILDDPDQRRLEAEAVLAGRPVPTMPPAGEAQTSAPTAAPATASPAAPTAEPAPDAAAAMTPAPTAVTVQPLDDLSLDDLLTQDIWQDVELQTPAAAQPADAAAETGTDAQAASEAYPAVPVPGALAQTVPLGEGETEVTLTFGGDAVIGTRETWWRREDGFPACLEKNGMAYPFSGLRDIFSADDMTFVNLECTLKANRDGEREDKMYRFRGLPAWTAVLTEGSIEQVNIANNHYIDYQAAGKRDTRRALQAAGIPFSGYTFTYIWEKDGHRIGFAGVRETMYLRDKAIIAREVAGLREKGCEVVIYSCHWGVEYSPSHNETQLEMAQAAAAAGVDILVGTHPHVVQGVERMGDTAVLWSLGNLMFGGTIELSTFDAVLVQARLRFGGAGYRGCELTLIPILTSGRAAEGLNDFRPVPAEGADKARILALIQADSPEPIAERMWFPARK